MKLAVFRNAVTYIICQTRSPQNAVIFKNMGAFFFAFAWYPNNNIIFIINIIIIIIIFLDFKFLLFSYLDFILTLLALVLSAIAGYSSLGC
jgi:membrane-bound ClpP family serine protease